MAAGDLPFHGRSLGCLLPGLFHDLICLSYEMKMPPAVKKKVVPKWPA